MFYRDIYMPRSSTHNEKQVTTAPTGVQNRITPVVKAMGEARGRNESPL